MHPKCLFLPCPQDRILKEAAKALLLTIFSVPSSLLLVMVGWAHFGAMASIPEHHPTTTAWGSINRAKSRRKTLAEMQTQHRGATPAPRLPRELPCPDLHAERSWCCGLSFAKVRGNDGDPEHQLRPPRRNLRTSKHTGRASTGQVRGACLAYSHLLG